MNLGKYLPQKFRRLSGPEKAAITLGAALGVGFLIYRTRTSSRERRQTIAVKGVWTDIATKLGMPIGDDMDIKTAQQYLNDISHAGLKVNGVLDARTSNALRAFQRGNGLPETGVIDEETGNALQYLRAAVSKSPAFQKLATVSPGLLPAEKVTYRPAPMPAPVTYRRAPSPAAVAQAVAAQPPAPTPMQQAQMASWQPGMAPIDLGAGWVMYGDCACPKGDQGCAQACQGASDFAVGAQSTTMFDARTDYGSGTFGTGV
jgi:hypothetical protein